MACCYCCLGNYVVSQSVSLISLKITFVNMHIFLQNSYNDKSLGWGGFIGQCDLLFAPYPLLIANLCILVGWYRPKFFFGRLH